MKRFTLMTVLLDFCLYNCSGVASDQAPFRKKSSGQRIVKNLLPKTDNTLPLVMAVYKNDINHVKQLIRSGAPINGNFFGCFGTLYEEAPLMIAAHQGNLDIA